MRPKAEFGNYMVEFNTGYYAPIDKVYHTSDSEIVGAARLEDPIIPVKQLGTTVSERVSVQRFGNLIQGVAAELRKGVGTIQLVMDFGDGVVGQPKGYGPEVREKIRELVKANDALIVGIEMPVNQMNNLSGFDGRQKISEEIRQKELSQVRDAIKFTADVAQGGSVDVLSWEFPRPVFEAEWNNKKDKWDQAFEIPKERETEGVHFVDTQTGAVSAHRLKNLPSPDLNEKDPEKTYTWEDYKKYFKDNEKELARDDIKNPFELFKKRFFGRQLTSAKFEIARIQDHIEDHRKAIDEIERVRSGESNAEKKKELEDRENKYKERIKAFEDQARQQKILIKENEENLKHLHPLDKYAKNNSILSYAEAGVMAMEETEKNPTVKRPVYVGPELGWPHSYGGHPDEFIELIQKARKRMVDLLTKEKIVDDITKEERKNPYHRPELSKKDAEEEAKLHIKGTFDTSHLGMWLNEFRRDLPYDKRVKEFEKWYIEQVEKVAKADVVGGIQLVNSISGEHGHLPPDQGIFPVVDAAKIFKKHGFSGFLVSEGHAEESFGEGRMFIRTWKAFNSPINSDYGVGGGFKTWRDVHSNYMGQPYSPRQMFGSYTPPMAEYRPWAGGKNPVSFE